MKNGVGSNDERRHVRPSYRAQPVLIGFNRWGDSFGVLTGWCVGHDSDGRQLWATNGYSLHARQVAIEKQGQVTLSEEGLFQVNEDGRLPDFAASLPQSQPTASLVIERDKLLQALAGQDQHVRLTFFADDQTIELSSAGAYALVMPLTGLDEEDFWRPDVSGL